MACQVQNYFLARYFTFMKKRPFLKGAFSYKYLNDYPNIQRTEYFRSSDHFNAMFVILAP